MLWLRWIMRLRIAAPRPVAPPLQLARYRSARDMSVVKNRQLKGLWFHVLVTMPWGRRAYASS